MNTKLIDYFVGSNTSKEAVARAVAAQYEQRIAELESALSIAKDALAIVSDTSEEVLDADEFTAILIPLELLQQCDEALAKIKEVME